MKTSVTTQLQQICVDLKQRLTPAYKLKTVTCQYRPTENTAGMYVLRGLPQQRVFER